MPSSAYYFGHLAHWDEKTEKWRYADTGESCWEVPHRPCPKCHMIPVGNPETPNDAHDPCIANLPGVKFACCGHGVKGIWGEGYITFEDGRVIRFKNMHRADDNQYLKKPLDLKDEMP